MRAMILAAGLGTRLRPLTDWRPKPALPVRGVPLVALLLRLLSHHGVREVMVNLHHHADLLRDLVERERPADLEVHYSREIELLGTGGALRRVADFLRESDPCLVLAGDMLLDVDLAAAVDRHRARGDRATLLLRGSDPRAGLFGTIGIDGQGCVRRIGRRFDLGGETGSGIFVSVRLLSPDAFDDQPERDAFEDLGDWLAPALSAGARGIRAEVLPPADCVWEPVGTLPEYLQANLETPALSYADVDRLAATAGTRFEPGVVVGAGAHIEPGARLERAVVWDGERVPAGLRARNGIFAGGRFHSCDAETDA